MGQHVSDARNCTKDEVNAHKFAEDVASSVVMEDRNEVEDVVARHN